jgi:hypothetical protein
MQSMHFNNKVIISLNNSLYLYLFNQIKFIMMTTNSTTTSLVCPEVIFTPSGDVHLTPKTTTATKSVSLSVARSQRKFSFPANFHSATLLNAESNSNVIARTTRRLSANIISDRVTDRVRKLSTAMGFGLRSPSKEILLSQAKFLITLYIRFRLKRSPLLNQQKKKLGLQKIQRSMLGIGDVKEVFLAIKEVTITIAFSSMWNIFHICIESRIIK